VNVNKPSGGEMFARPAKFQNGAKQRQEPPPPTPQSVPALPQPAAASVALMLVVFDGLAIAVPANASTPTSEIVTTRNFIVVASFGTAAT